VEQLALKRNSLRQEEITEEIEVIMLSVDAMAREQKTPDGAGMSNE
jgi:hypothetical protein